MFWGRGYEHHPYLLMLVGAGQVGGSGLGTGNWDWQPDWTGLDRTIYRRTVPVRNEGSGSCMYGKEDLHYFIHRDTHRPLLSSSLYIYVQEG